MTDLLLIVPPFAFPDQPSLAAHLLQACARREGLTVKVCYANALLARRLGADYRLVAQGSYSLMGERLFARAAWGLPPLGRNAGLTFDWASMFGTADYGLRDQPFVPFPPVPRPTLEDLFRIEAEVYAWTVEVAETLAGDYRAYGCTTSFEQNNAAFALLGALKRRHPEALTLVGGANAEGQLAQGLASLEPGVDVVFQGESERAFVEVLKDWREGRKPARRVVMGQLCRDLDALPEPTFDDFFDQVATPRVDLPYEASRGCWWGQRSPCLFCAYEPEKFTFRAKSADRVFADWQALAQRYPGLRVQTTDLIMPPEYFTTLLPRLAEADLPLELYWEQKADLTWDQLKLLKAAKVLEIQPGIENFSSALLGRIHKGARPSKSLNLLRWAAMLGVRVYWNLLWGIPGETLADYQPVLHLIRLIPHLTPPFGLSQLLVLRHSRYQAEPQRWGLDRVDPVRTFADVYPEGADLEHLSTFFHPTYEAETLRCPEFFETLHGLFTEWNQSFVGTDQRRVLFLLPQGPDAYLLLDTRRLPDTTPAQGVDARRAASLLRSEPYEGTEDQIWALEHHLAVVLDGDYVPLALTTPEVMEKIVWCP